MGIKTEHKKFDNLLCDEKKIFRLLQLTSDIPSKMFYFALGVEIYPTVCTTSKCETFCQTSENLISKMSKQFGSMAVLAKALTKIQGRHFQTFRKFYNPFKELVDSLLKNLDSLLDSNG